MATDQESMLNIFEVEIEDRVRHLICFLTPEIAQREGIDSRKIVGEFTPDERGEFTPETFQPNPQFVETYTRYMNREVVQTPELALLALEKPGQILWLVDPRHPSESTEEPPPSNVVGRFKINAEGWIEPDSFQYNPKHRWFDPEHGVSGVFQNRDFFEWLNAGPSTDSDAPRRPATASV